LDQAIEELEGAGEVKERLDAAGRTLAPIFPDNFPEPLRIEYASIREALTWLPGGRNQGTAESTLAAMTDEEASSPFALPIILGNDPSPLGHTATPQSRTGLWRG